jgi:hypothetical protein
MVDQLSLLSLEEMSNFLTSRGAEHSVTSSKKEIKIYKTGSSIFFDEPQTIEIRLGYNIDIIFWKDNPSMVYKLYTEVYTWYPNDYDDLLVTRPESLFMAAPLDKDQYLYTDILKEDFLCLEEVYPELEFKGFRLPWKFTKVLTADKILYHDKGPQMSFIEALEKAIK